MNFNRHIVFYAQTKVSVGYMHPKSSPNVHGLSVSCYQQLLSLVCFKVYIKRESRSGLPWEEAWSCLL